LSNIFFIDMLQRVTVFCFHGDAKTAAHFASAAVKVLLKDKCRVFKSVFDTLNASK